MSVINDFKCVDSLCESDAAQISSAGMIINQRENVLDTDDAAASANGSNS